MKEAELIAAARAGDEDAFRELYKSHETRVRVAGRAILGTDDLDDLTQDVFLLAWKGIAGFRGESPFRTWVTSIARNQCFAVRKQRQRDGAYSADLSADQEHSSWADQRSAGLIEVHCDLSGLMSGLPTQNRQLLEMNLEGLSDREIASAMALSVSAVRGRLQRARDAMREKIDRPPEHFASPPSLMGDRANSRDEIQHEGIPKMATPSRKRRRLSKTEVAGAADLATGFAGDGPAKQVLPDGTESDLLNREPDSGPDSFEELLAEVKQLEYLAAIESRRQFEAEIVGEAEKRLREAISKLLIGGDFDPCHEEAICHRLVRAISANTFIREDLARLQQVRMGIYSREVRLWYIGAAAQNYLPDVVSEVLQEAKVKASASSAPRECK